MGADDRVVDRRPLSVVARDQDALRQLITLHATPSPRIVDVTHNTGKMWRGTPYTPYRVDKRPDLLASGQIDLVADFRDLHALDPGAFDVVVFDPPHVTDAGRSGVLGPGEWGDSYGLDDDELRGQASVGFLFAPFFREAQRILAPGTGLVLVKIADMVHGGEYRWQHVEVHDAARALGFTPCDLVIRVAYSRGGLNDPRWRHVNHVRQVHAYWMAIRNGPKCVSPHAPEIARTYPMGPLFDATPTAA